MDILVVERYKENSNIGQHFTILRHFLCVCIFEGIYYFIGRFELVVFKCFHFREIYSFIGR